jgi:hypothetical protein
VSDEVAARLAAELERRGLSEPARLLIEAHRPLAPLLSDLGAALAPLVRLGAGASGTQAAALAADERALDRLIDAIDATGDRDAQPR